MTAMSRVCSEAPMAVDPSYMTYAHRRPGMDHDLYEPGYLPDRAPVLWPGGRRLAVWIVPVVEVFPLNMAPQPLVPPGGMTRPYPDYWNYTLQDYGNRVGIYRILDALVARGMQSSAAVSAVLADRYPDLLRDLLSAGCEIIAHGRDMGTLHAPHLNIADEAAIIASVRDRLAQATGQAPRGWLSPAMVLSHETTRLVAEAGFAYTCDWVNDELPYRMTGPAKGLTAMPLGYELSDLRLMLDYRHMAWEYERQVQDALVFLLAEARRVNAGRILALPLHPWLVGTPQRISALERLLDMIAAEPDVWVASGDDILSAWEAGQ
ncbi:MAG: polysaccharide deacetylase family protein [Pararhodobacter sp.]|nr:polysaccharide deacetylase family protein [Pararhodobacter sp.]